MKHIVTKGVATGLLTAPTAHITTNKSRKKIHTGNQVYLKDGENFEFEIFNPSTSSVLAKIKLNGKEISSSGIIIKPGQRVFLDRFLDSPNKFKFETYEVNGNNEQVLKAIDLNGSVEVNFYNEKVYYNYPNYTTFPYTYTTTPYYNTPDYYKDSLVGICQSTNNNISKDLRSVVYGSTSNNIMPTTAYVSNTSIPLTSTGTYTVTSLNSSSNNIKVDINNFVDANALEKALQANKTKKTITGTVEKGEKSNQEFEYVNKSFDNYILNSVKYKILPLENKPVEVAEIKKVKNFCGMCRENIKDKNFKFCPNCGNSL